MFGTLPPGTTLSDPPARLQGALADRYRFDRELGTGGMATVYLAHDLKHERKVAVKVLRPELVHALGPERFLREITTTANLHHPHILPLYDSGRTPEVSGALLYYVMPFVEGESLRDRINREKQLPLDDALRIAREVADALSYAHGRGVIHRDIKPENILLESGHALVSDFGIAWAVSSAGADRLTETGLVVGTPAYMSPEQGAGERDLDGRSDLYALGCVLYEMLSGQPPFTGPKESIVRQHLTATPPPVTQLRPAVPRMVAAALERALAKSPADRFHSVGEFAAALGDRETGRPAEGTYETPVTERSSSSIAVWAIALAAALGFLWLGLRTWGPATGSSAPAAPRSIAVLPLENLRGDSSSGYVSQGVAEEILHALAQIPELRVAARTSSFQFAGKSVDIREVGRLLDVATVLEGSIQRSGDTVRITTQLIDARTGYHLWSGKFDRPMANLFAVEDEISRTIADTLKVSLGLVLRRARGPVDPVALDFYFRGLALIPMRGSALPTAMAYLDSALARDSTFAPAWASVAVGDELLPVYYLAPFGSSMEAAKLAAERAIALDSGSVRAYVAMANVYRDLGQWSRAERAYRRALDLGPNDPEAIEQFGQFLLFVGQIPDALHWLDRARRLDPLAPIPAGVEGNVLTILKQYDSAAVLLNRTVALGPSLPIGPLWSMWNDLTAGRYNLAEQMGRRGAEAAGLDPETYTFAIRAVADPRLRRAALNRLAEIPDTVPWEFNANVRMDWLALLGDTLGALNALELGPQRGSAWFNPAIWSPAMDPVRNHPRYVAALGRMGLPYRATASQ
jgi:serine/threonine protein kinase/Tfp pilus assembly protein PilF